MRDVKRLHVKQFRIFAPDLIPIGILSTGGGQDLFKKQFQFKEAAAELTGELIFRSGVAVIEASNSEDEPEENRVVVIRTLQINERRVVLEVEGDSATATAAYARIEEVLVEIDGFDKFGDSIPIVLTEETSCSVTLDFEWTSLVGHELLDFAESYLLPVAGSEISTTRIAGLTLRIGLRFEPTQSDVTEYGISLSEKPFIVEPRGNTPLSERRYLTASPTGSEVHLSLLEQLEAIVGNK